MNDFEKAVLDDHRVETEKGRKHTNNIIIALIIALGLAITGLVVEHGMTLIYLYQYDFNTTVTTTTTVEQDTKNGGNANFIGGDGDITNGKTEDY